jgi:hypothetical protein
VILVVTASFIARLFCVFILDNQVKNQMLLLSKSDKKDSGHPNYSWLSQKPRLSSRQKEKLEALTTKVTFLMK